MSATFQSKRQCIVLLIIWWSCFTSSLLIGQESPESSSIENLKVISYNTHGGHGDVQKNLKAFKNLLQGDEHVLCLQELGPDIWEEVKSIFPEYRYTYKVWQKTTTPDHEPWLTGGGILSKLPIIEPSEGLIQVDPGGDLWERRAAFVKLQTGPNPETDYINLSHYHNTYNWDKEDFQSERKGMENYRRFVMKKLEVSSLSTDKPYIMAGDWNIFVDHVKKVLHDTPHHFGNGRDHHNSNSSMLKTTVIPTIALDLSDHNAVEVTYDIPVTVMEK